MRKILSEGCLNVENLSGGYLSNYDDFYYS
jgi:hypothetical protein